MKKRLFIILTLACSILLSACAQNAGEGNSAGSTKTTANSDVNTGKASNVESTKAEESEAAGPYHKITAEEARQMIDGNDSVTIVDVRTEEEYAAGHIPGAILIPLQTIGEEKPAELPDTDARLIVYCRSGVRSKQASDLLAALGYKNIYDMGGIIDWTYETEADQTP